MKSTNTESVRERVLALIENGYKTDSAFEKELGLPPKTVNNWRRGRSASFMKMLPTLSAAFGVSIGEMLNPSAGDNYGELTDDEKRLLAIYRSSQGLPNDLRRALIDSVEALARLYIKTAADAVFAPKGRGRHTDGKEGQSAD